MATRASRWPHALLRRTHPSEDSWRDGWRAPSPRVEPSNGGVTNLVRRSTTMVSSGSPDPKPEDPRSTTRSTPVATTREPDDGAYALDGPHMASTTRYW